MKEFIGKLKKRIKGAIKSSTIWFNAVGVPALMYAQENSELWVDLFGSSGTTLLAIITIVNAMLRFKTTTDLADK